MMDLNQAITYGKQIGVKYYANDIHGNIVGGTKMLEQAREMQRQFEMERQNPYSEHLHFRIEMV